MKSLFFIGLELFLLSQSVLAQPIQSTNGLTTVSGGTTAGIAGLSVEFRLLSEFDMPRGLCLSWSRDKKGHLFCLLRYLPY